MSKKWKNKLKKQKARLIQETINAQKVQAEKEMPKMMVAEEKQAPMKISGKLTRAEKIKLEKPEEESLLPEVTKVKQDIRKIGVIVGALVIIIVAATIFDGRYNWVVSTADLIGKHLKF